MNRISCNYICKLKIFVAVGIIIDLALDSTGNFLSYGSSGLPGGLTSIAITAHLLISLLIALSRYPKLTKCDMVFVAFGGLFSLSVAVITSHIIIYLSE